MAEGGAIRAYGFQYFSVSGSSFTNNKVSVAPGSGWTDAYAYGGAISIPQMATPAFTISISSCTFRNNSIIASTYVRPLSVILLTFLQ